MTDLEGIDPRATEAWIAARVSLLPAPFEWIRLTGGTSNLTYRVRARNGREAVVRRPPTGKLLPKAHDMGREYKILSGLEPTPVPVAQPLACCTDPEVTGAPFYVMEFCQGHTVRDAAWNVHPLSAPARARYGESMIDALVELHAQEPAEVGLADLGRPDAYIARQLNRWMDSWNKSHEAARLDLPSVAACFELLSSRIPEQGPARVVHGDYGPHNMLVDDEGQVVAITDWEIGTLGDPLADLAYVINGWSLGHSETQLPYGEGRLEAGYATRAALLDRYRERSGRRLDDLPFYIAFNYFKSACIVQGVYARFQRGVRGAQGLDLEAFKRRIERTARSAEIASAALSRGPVE